MKIKTRNMLYTKIDKLRGLFLTYNIYVGAYNVLSNTKDLANGVKAKLFLFIM